MTYAQEKKEKDAAKAKKARKYRYDPVLMDAMRPLAGLSEGDIVVKVQPHGCPKNGTMGQTYIGKAETGAFIGMVSVNSLIPVKKGS